MKTTFTTRIFATVLVLASTLVATSSFAALNAYLKLKGQNGKSYTCTSDASGKFSFSDVEPGEYKLLWVMPPDKGEPTGACSIEISSFSWGASNQAISPSSSGERVGEKTPQVSRSNIANNRTAAGSGGGAGKVSVSDLSVMIDASKLRKQNNGGQVEYYTIVLENVMVSSVCSPSGSVSNLKASWNLKENVK